MEDEKKKILDDEDMRCRFRELQKESSAKAKKLKDALARTVYVSDRKMKTTINV